MRTDMQGLQTFPLAYLIKDANNSQTFGIYHLHPETNEITLRVARLRKRRCVGALGNGRAPGHSWRAASAPASAVAFRREYNLVP